MINNRWKRVSVAIIFLLPALTLYITLMIVPIFQSVKLSFYSWNGVPAKLPEFIGISNFERMFCDPDFWHSMVNIGWFILGSIVIEMPLALIYALIINSHIPGYRIFRVSYFIPVILPITAVGLMWRFVLYPTGAFNILLQTIGLGSLATDWLGNMNTAVFAVVVINKIVFAGLNMLIFIAGLAAVPTNVYEAASIDGAKPRQRLIYITIPLLKESFKIFTITAVTGSIRMFDILYVMTGGGPNGSSDVPATLLYFEAFRYDNFGYASSIGTVILLLSLCASVILNYFFGNSRGECK